MALDPNAFGPDSGNDSQQPGLRQQKMRALLGGKASLGSLFNEANDTSDLSKSSLNGGETSSPLATPGLGAEPATPSLLASERVERAPSFAGATPLLTGDQQAGAELGEASRGEEGVIGGGAGRQGLSTADRNRALMSFFRPQQSAQDTAAQPSDSAKAVGSAKSAVGAVGKARSLFSGSPFSGLTEALPKEFGSSGTFLGGPTAHEMGGIEPTGSAPSTNEFGPSNENFASTRDAVTGDGGFSMPDFSAKNVGSGIGLGGSLLSLAGGASGDPNVSRAGQAASLAGHGTSFAIDPSVAGGLGLLGAGLGAAGQATKNPDVVKAGQAANVAASGAAFAGSLAGTANPLGVFALPFAVKGLNELINPKNTRYTMARHATTDQGANEVRGLGQLYGSVPQGDASGTLDALRAKLDPRGAVRSYFAPPTDSGLGLNGDTQWRDMSPEQFNAVMSWLSQDPARLNAIQGSGDLPYLDPQAAGNYGNLAAQDARALIARQLGLPYTPPPEPTPGGPSTPNLWDLQLGGM